MKLVKKYGSADAVLQHLDDLTPKLKQNFIEHADKLKMSRQLVTLRAMSIFRSTPRRAGIQV